jgi:hypothetical protein
LSFFDEGDDPPTRAARPRRPTTPSRRGGHPDDQQVRVRRAIAAGIGLVVIIVFFFGVKGCLDSRKQTALKDYNRDVTAVAVDSREQVSRPFFQLVSAGGKSANDLEVQVNQLRVTAEDDVRRAQRFNVPGDMKAAQQNLLLALTLRAGALGKIAGEMRSALGDQGAQDALDRIAGQMESFVASDVVYLQRVIPFIQQGLEDNGVGGQTIATSQFLPDLRWLAPAYVGQRLNVRATSTGSSSGAVRSGTHGHGLTSVSVAGVTLQPGQVTNHIPAGTPTFDVKFTNQGENDEFGVLVKVTVRGGAKPITAQRRVDQTKSRADAQATLSLPSTPPVGVPVTIDVSIGKVPGEKTTDNNKSSYIAIFER